MSKVVCDPEAFYPLRNLVAGPLTDLRELADVERFVRAVVLHDEISMELEPCPYDSCSELEFTEEEQGNGMRNVIVALGPVLTGYDFFTKKRGIDKPTTQDKTLSPSLMSVAREFSNADEGNVYYRTHVNYLERIVSIIREGGSALLNGEFGNAAFEASSAYPETFFENLDRDWQQFARDAEAGELGLVIPPVLSIVLTRCARRDAIPTILKDLRDEWANARAKVWTLLSQLKTVKTISQKKDIQQELQEASRLMAIGQHEIDTKPVRVLWDLVAGSVAGAATAMLSGGNPAIGAAVGVLGMASRSVAPLVSELGPALFGRGAFDLARRVRRDVMYAEHDSLARLLTDVEKSKLGLR